MSTNELELDGSILQDEYLVGHGEDLHTILTVVQEYVRYDGDDVPTAIVNKLVDSYTEGYDTRSPFNDIISYIADITPYSSPIHPKLARLVRDFRDSDLRKKKSGTIGVPKRDAFLQHFIEDLSDRRVEPLGAVQDDVDPIEFVNFEAFLARLLAVDISTDFMGFAEEPMIWAFKDDHSGQDQRLRDAYVLAAAQWILTSASALLALCQEGKRYLTVAKWMEWQEGFRKVADDEQHSQECRKIAGQVADMMALEEKVVKG